MTVRARSTRCAIANRAWASAQVPAGALQRALALLTVLGEYPGELTVAQLASDTGMPTSTAYRLLAELEQHGLIRRGADRTIALGTRLVALGRTAEDGLRERLVVPAASVMERLSEEVGETAILTAPCGLEAIALHVVETELHSVRLTYALFRRAPMHRGASGKILAAFLEVPERERLLLTAAAPELAGALERIRADRLAYTDGELDPAAAAVAAPIFDRRGRIAAGISVAGPRERILGQLKAASLAVGTAAQIIERAYTH
jgi:DNA-binding IclR family transcriptional regulator